MASPSYPRWLRCPAGLGCGDLGGHPRTAGLAFGFRGISYRYVLETHSHDEVAGPVAEASDGDGSGPRALAEQFGNDKPGDGPWADFKEDDEEEDGNHADIAHPGKLALREGALCVTVSTQLSLIITNYFNDTSFSDISFYSGKWGLDMNN